MILQLNDIRKEFKGRSNHSVLAVDDVSMQVEAGEFIVVNGASGSGKSTLLFTMGAMLPPTSGQVVCDGTDLYALSPSRRSKMRNLRIGFVFQTFNLISYLNSLENVAFPALLAGSSKKAAMQRAEDLLNRLGLGERLSHLPVELSVGERQRVAICRGLVNAPDILLADEPTGNMDPELTQETMELFRGINRQGQTIVMVTHNPELSETGNRHVLMEKGSIRAERIVSAEDKAL
ncbi:MAG: ABC transporter ATP-binding protein [Desulfobacteraceae bacterium]|nr:ABC transporter ATP-binding protein [Desulfobacteraceae bacterium]MCF8035241.1 ABC transporter ATP-binding protein [Desulfobacteraceae bacterium]